MFWSKYQQQQQQIIGYEVHVQASKWPLKMTSAEPIFAFMEINVLLLKRKHIFQFWFLVFCSFIVPY